MHFIPSAFVLFGVLALGVGVADATLNTKRDFDFKDPKEVSSVTFFVDSMLEPFSGWADGVTGDVTFDANDVAATRGTIVIDANTVDMNNPGMAGAMRGTWFLDTENHPEITYEIREVVSHEVDPLGRIDAVVMGDLTLHGETKPVEATVRAEHLAGRMQDRSGGPVPGDLLVVRAEFSIDRLDFGVGVGQGTAVIGPTIDVRVAIVGSSPQPE